MSEQIPFPIALHPNHLKTDAEREAAEKMATACAEILIGSLNEHGKGHMVVMFEVFVALLGGLLALVDAETRQGIAERMVADSVNRAKKAAGSLGMIGIADIDLAEKIVNALTPRLQNGEIDSLDILTSEIKKELGIGTSDD